MQEKKLGTIEAQRADVAIDDQLSVLRSAFDQILALRGEPGASERGAVVEYEIPDVWKRKLFLALCRRRGLAPYRERGMPCSAVRLRVPSRSFDEQTLWPEYLALATKLHARLDEIVDCVIREDVHADAGDAHEGAEAADVGGDAFHAGVRGARAGERCSSCAGSREPRGRAGYAATGKARRSRARS
jgi:hypothetical protein